jgi:hypothetical protein
MHKRNKLFRKCEKRLIHSDKLRIIRTIDVQTKIKKVVLAK